MRTFARRALTTALLLTTGACGTTSTPVDAATSDAFVAPDTGITQVQAHGFLASVAPDLSFGWADGFRACSIGVPTSACSDIGLIGEYRLNVPANQELALRFFDPADATAIPWIKPLTSGTANVNAYVTAMPRTALVQTLLGSVGGFASDQGYAVIYVENHNPPSATSVMGAGIAGYTVTATDGVVRYVADDFTGVTGGAATTTAGLALVTGITAPTYADGAALTGTVTLTLHAPAGGTLCADAPADNQWIRAHDASSITVEAPVFDGHITYALFIDCP